MTRCLNRAELIGHLGDAPVIRMLESGQAMATFSVATSWRWNDADDKAQEATEWSRCVVFGPLAEYCGDQLQTGTRVYIRGRLRTHRWEDTAGVTRERTEIVAHEVVPFDGERRPPSRLATATPNDAVPAHPRPPPLTQWRR
jgi:single-strand DNA-binding protein